MKIKSEHYVFIVASLINIITILVIWLIPDSINGEGQKITNSVPDSVKFFTIGLILIGLLTPIKQKIWKFLFLFLLIVSMFPILNVSSINLSVGIGQLTINLIPTLLLLAHLYYNRDIIKTLTGLSQNEIRQIKANQIDYKNKEIKRFMDKFQTKTINELQKIKEDKDMVNEAREAAKRLLEI